MDERSVLDWKSDRRFGVEMELNAFDGKSRPDNRESLPSGINVVGNVISETIHEPTQVTGWHNTHNNENWIVKPDSSCGIEVCSPVLKGYVGLEKAIKVSLAFHQHPQINSDSRCSYHVHVNLHDCSPAQCASIIAHWIKCEAVFIDSVPSHRKRSRYCQVIGLCDMFDCREVLHPKMILERMGRSKYFTLNNYHMARDKRTTIEFRIAENDACIDPFFVKNWTKLVVHFCDRAKDLPIPGKFCADNPWSSLCWLDPKDVFRLLGFFPDQYDLSPGLKQTRDWFLARLVRFTRHSDISGVFSDEGRYHSWKETSEIIKMLAERGEYITDASLYPTSGLENALFDIRFRR